MSQVKRYESDMYGRPMTEEEYGYWVEFDAYKILQAERDRLLEDNRRLKEALRALTPDPHDEGLILTHDELKAADLLAELDGGKT